jgi:hypothetical protein
MRLETVAAIIDLMPATTKHATRFGEKIYCYMS